MKHVRFTASSALIALVLSGCSMPGNARTEILSREGVAVGGRSCEYISRRTDTNTINGIHRHADGVIRCNAEEFACGQSPPAQCVAAVAADLDRRRSQ